MDSLDIDRWETEYLRTRGTFDSFTRELERLLRQLLSVDEIEYAQLDARTKDVASFRNKLQRKGESYTNPLDEVTDLSGLRIILYFPDDITAVGALIEREFDVDWENSEKQGADSDPDRFGYRSDHYVVRVGATRCQHAEWRAFAEKRAEIQVRTVMQHAWAAVDHKTRYKGTELLPRELQRRLYRLSALLEVADEQFAALQDASKDLSHTYAVAIANGDLAVPLDALSLSAYLDHLGDVWVKRASAAGWDRIPERVVEEVVAPTRDSRIEDLLAALRRMGLKSVGEFDEWLRRADTWADGAFSLVQQKLNETSDETHDEDIHGWGKVFATRENALLILVHIGIQDPDWVDAEGWRSDLGRAIKAAFAAVTANGTERK